MLIGSDFMSLLKNNKRKIMENEKLIANAVNMIREMQSVFLEEQHKTESSDVKYSRKVSISDYEEWERENAEYKSFSQSVLDGMNEKGLTAIQFYKKAHIDRKLFSKLKTDYCYKPNKTTAIKLCFALDLSITPAEELLKKAGYALSKSDPFDLVIRYCFACEITDIDIVNEILIRLDEKTL